MTTHPLRWQAPQPLWSRFGGDAAAVATASEQACPTILRFATDEFMEQILATLARDPARIDKLVARFETWRKPMSEAPDLVERSPLPRLAQKAARAAAAAKPKALQGAGAADDHPLKLYQSAHQRYYLVSASLVCGVQGLPDRSLVPGDAEQINFVMRRMLPVPGATVGSTVLREFAYIKDAQGARWQRCSAGADASQFVAGEERLPLFPLTFQDDNRHSRVMWSGLVPVGRREEYLGVKIDQSVAPNFAAGQRASMSVVQPVVQNSKLARMTQFQMDVAEPWKTLIRSAHKVAQGLSGNPTIGEESEPPEDTRKRIFDFNLQQQSASWLILLDCADHIASYLPDVWQVIDNNGQGFASLSQARKNFYTCLDSATMPVELKNALKTPDFSIEFRPPLTSMRAALKAIRAPGIRDKLEASTLTYTKDSYNLSLTEWPSFHFVLAGLNTSAQPDGPYKAFSIPAATGSEVDADPLAGPVPGQDEAKRVDQFTTLFALALEASPETDAPPLPYARQVRDSLTALNPASANLSDFNDGGWFVVRFVHMRRDCGPLHPPLLSAPTQRFKLAGFFDADAPARPIRISLPLDTSAAGLRKFNRNTAFVMSDMLCGQVQRAKGLGLIDLVLSVLPWPLHKSLDMGAGGPCKNDKEVNIGMICSLSIPIITICALILLMIIVSLLDMIFRWMPYFVMCFPIPGLKGKKGSS